MKAILPVLLLFVLLLTSCKRETEQLDLSAGKAYYPLRAEGQSWHYRVDSIVYNAFLNIRDTASFELLERSAGEAQDGQGNSYYRIERYRRNTEQEPWHLLNVRPILYRDIRLEQVEDNLRRIDMVLPQYQGQNWNGLVYLRRDTSFVVAGEAIQVFKGWGNFEVTELHSPYMQWDSTLLVLRANSENLIERRFSSMRYAWNIGLVERRDSILDSQCGGNLSNCIGLSWAEKAEVGYILEQTLISYQED